MTNLKTKLTEKHFKKLGFKKIDAEDYDGLYFYFYELELFADYRLISESEDCKNWTVSVFELDEIEIKDFETLIEHIEHMKKITS
jgi:hypothetical protein